MGRESPRTVGCAKRDPRTGKCLEGQEFQRFGVSQLVKDPEAFMGVRAVVPPSVDPFGGSLKGFFGSATIRDTAYPPLTITKAVESGLKQPLIPSFEFPDLFGGGNGNGKCHLDDNKPFCAITQAIGGEVCECPDWITGKVTDPTAGGRGCECEACKNGTGQCDASAPECDAWDLACIGGTHVTDIITDPVSSWWEKYGIWVYVILGVIGLGVLLWLLRPLFGMIGAFKGGSP